MLVVLGLGLILGVAVAAARIYFGTEKLHGKSRVVTA